MKSFSHKKKWTPNGIPAKDAVDLSGKKLFPQLIDKEHIADLQGEIDKMKATARKRNKKIALLKAQCRKYRDRATEATVKKASLLACSTDFSIKKLNIHRVACAIVSHSVEESGGSSDNGKTNEHLVNYAVSKIKELM